MVGDDFFLHTPIVQEGVRLAGEEGVDVVLVAERIDGQVPWGLHVVAELCATGAEVIVLAQERNHANALSALADGAFAYVERTNRRRIEKELGAAVAAGRARRTSVATAALV